MNYDGIAHIVKLGGTVLFFLIFISVIAYALWPKNKSKFDRAASLPLDDNDAPQIDDDKS